MSLAATTRSHKHVLTPWSKQGAVGGPTFVRGEGSFIYDDTGKRYLDLSAGLVSTNLGHGHPAVVKAIQEQVAKVAYVPPSLMNDTRSEFAELLSDISPWEEGARTFFGDQRGPGQEEIPNAKPAFAVGSQYGVTVAVPVRVPGAQRCSEVSADVVDRSQLEAGLLQRQRGGFGVGFGDDEIHVVGLALAFQARREVHVVAAREQRRLAAVEARAATLAGSWLVLLSRPARTVAEVRTSMLVREFGAPFVGTERRRLLETVPA